MSFYGTALVTREKDVTDIIGIRTLVLRQAWQPSSSNLSQDQIDAQTPSVPIVSATLLLVGQQTLPSGGVYVTKWTFEGVWGNGSPNGVVSGPSVPFKDRLHSIDYGFTPGMAQVPIQQHPFFQQMLTQYGGYPDTSSGRVLWPPFLPTANTSANGMAGTASASSDQTPNPMFERQDYYAINGTYRHRYAALSLPPQLYTNYGTIAETTALPGKPPQNLPAGLNWLVVAPIYKRRGTVFDIEEQYWLSWAGGWPIAPYTTPTGTGGTSWPSPAQQFTGMSPTPAAGFPSPPPFNQNPF